MKLLAALVALVAGMGAQISVWAQDDLRIIPGRRVGKIELGISYDEAKRRLGPPTEEDAALGGRFYLAYFKQASPARRVLIMGGLRGVSGIAVTSPEFKTAGGVSTATAWADIWKSFQNLKYVGEPSATQGMPEDLTEEYDDETAGISFAFRVPLDAPGQRTCGLIVVRAKGE